MYLCATRCDCVHKESLCVPERRQGVQCWPELPSWRWLQHMYLYSIRSDCMHRNCLPFQGQTSFPTAPPPTCPPDKPHVYCFVDPCQVTTCPTHPEARCVSDFCGGCNARFLDDEGNEVTKSCRCPIKGQQFNRCGSACPPTCTNPNPICTRQCVPRCQCPRGKVLDKRRKKCVFPFQCFH